MIHLRCICGVIFFFAFLTQAQSPSIFPQPTPPPEISDEFSDDEDDDFPEVTVYQPEQNIRSNLPVMQVTTYPVQSLTHLCTDQMPAHPLSRQIVIRGRQICRCAYLLFGYLSRGMRFLANQFNPFSQGSQSFRTFDFDMAGGAYLQDLNTPDKIASYLNPPYYVLGHLNRHAVEQLLVRFMEAGHGAPFIGSNCLLDNFIANYQIAHGFTDNLILWLQEQDIYNYIHEPITLSNDITLDLSYSKIALIYNQNTGFYVVIDQTSATPITLNLQSNMVNRLSDGYADDVLPLNFHGGVLYIATDESESCSADSDDDTQSLDLDYQ